MKEFVVNIDLTPKEQQHLHKRSKLCMLPTECIYLFHMMGSITALTD
jgi:hypothetical protein